jgi:hypothetical protein
MTEQDPYATPEPAPAPQPDGDLAVPADGTAPVSEDAAAASDAGTAGDFGLGTRVYGYTGTLAHVVADGRTTACGKVIDQTSPVQRLSRTPGGMICGACLGALTGA